MARLLKVLKQGVDEKISYSVDTSRWGGSPTNINVKIYETRGRTKTDVSDTCLVGDPSVSGNVISTSIVQLLTATKKYRLEVMFDTGTDTLEFYILIYAEE